VIQEKVIGYGIFRVLKDTNEMNIKFPETPSGLSRAQFGLPILTGFTFLCQSVSIILARPVAIVSVKQNLIGQRKRCTGTQAGREITTTVKTGHINLYGFIRRTQGRIKRERSDGRLLWKNKISFINDAG